ncbi:MAG TPA: metallophosphoesterase, partial [Pirellula sp.]|nr:metallophosphoesterase [Pirellula sp.]
MTNGNGWLDIRLHDVELTLLPERAVFSKEHSALFIADTHFGKDATFRKNGLPVPSGGCKDDLLLLLELINRTGATQLFILGDMFHARSSLAVDVVKEVGEFLACIPEMYIKLIRGNHDKF